MTKIRTGTAETFDLNGRPLTVRAKFNGWARSDAGFRRAQWTVKMTFQGRERSFKYNIGDGCEGANEVLDFADFAECVGDDADMAYGYDNYEQFANEFGYTDDRIGRAAWTGCERTATKLNCLFSMRRGEFMERAGHREWEACSDNND